MICQVHRLQHAEDDLNISLAVFLNNNYGGSFTESLETHDF